MKKILKITFISILCLIVAGGVGIGILLTSGEKEIEKYIVTDAAGHTYRVHIEKDTTYALVTDENGVIWGADFDGKTVGIDSTRVNLSDEYSIDQIPTQFAGEHVDQQADINEYMGQVDTSGSDGGENIQNLQQDNQPQPYRIQKYQNIIAGGTYLMTMTMIENGEQGDPATIAVKNGSLYVAMDMDGMTAKMLYMADNDTMYLIIDFMKKYCEIPEEMMGDDMDMSIISSAGDEIDELEEITVSEATLNGNRVICESYTEDDGTVFNYYFDEKDMLVRRDIIEADGSTDTTLFSQISTEVDDSYFEIPSGYGYLNISWLLQMGT